MISKLGQVMIYVNNQEDAVTFWKEQVGFVVKADESNDFGMRWIEIAPHAEAETSFVLHNKELISKMQPELNVGTPSVLLFTDDLDGLYRDFVSKGITVGDIVEMPTGRVFNFADKENNYFAILERK